DLAVAVARTWSTQGTADHGRDTPQFRDFRRVDRLLDAVEPMAMKMLATGIFELLDELSSHADGWATMQILHNARDLAWSHAENLAEAGLDSTAGEVYVDALDSFAAGLAEAALVPIG